MRKDAFERAIDEIMADGEKRGIYTRTCPHCGGDVGSLAHTHNWNNEHSCCQACHRNVKMDYSGTKF